MLICSYPQGIPLPEQIGIIYGDCQNPQMTNHPSRNLAVVSLKAKINEVLMRKSPKWNKSSIMHNSVKPLPVCLSFLLSPPCCFSPCYQGIKHMRVSMKLVMKMLNWIWEFHFHFTNYLMPLNNTKFYRDLRPEEQINRQTKPLS